MAQPANVVSRYDSARIIPEDLADVIELMAQEDTPMTSNIGRDKAQQTFHEWNTDALKAANEDNFLIEGDDVALESRPVTARVGNYTQIMTKVPGVTGTMTAISIVGTPKKQLARELMKSGRELKLDREKRICGIKPAVPGDDTTARQMAGFGCWLVTNDSRGGGTGADPTMSTPAVLFTGGYPSVSPVAGTARVFTEALLKSVMQKCYESGGKPTMAIMPPAQKVVFSTFPGIAAQRYQATGAKPTTIIGSADVYVSDFGNLAIVPDVFMPAGYVYLVDPEQASLVTLRPVNTTELAKTGDSEKRLMLWEGTLKVNNEKAHGVIGDLS